MRIATPACLTYTRRGEPAHLTPDVLATLPPEARAFQVSMVHFMDHLPPSHVSNCPGGGRAYFGSAPTFALATARDAITFDAHAKPSNDASSVFVGTPVGVKKISVEEYMRWVHATQPHAFVSLADERHSVEGAPAKKTRAAAERTAAWLETCAAMNDAREKVTNEEKNPKKTNVVPIAMFASVQGGCDVEARRASAKAAASFRGAGGGTTKDADVFGFSVGGLGTSEAPGAARRALVEACVSEFPRDKPVHVAGVSAPLEAIAMIEAGVDLLDNAFCHGATLAGKALRFPVDEADAARGRLRRRRVSSHDRRFGTKRRDGRRHSAPRRVSVFRRGRVFPEPVELEVPHGHAAFAEKLRVPHLPPPHARVRAPPVTVPRDDRVRSPGRAQPVPLPAVLRRRAGRHRKRRVRGVRGVPSEPSEGGRGDEPMRVGSSVAAFLLRLVFFHESNVRSS